jgi:hypothetical protein
MPKITDVGTLTELAERVGGTRKARALLQELDVPVVGGVFSMRLLLARLEGQQRPSRDGRVSDVAAALERYGLAVTEVTQGHPTQLRLVATRTVTLGSTAVEEPESPFAPQVVHVSEQLEAELHVATSRASSGMVGFGLSRVDQPGPPLIILYCVDEDRIWLVRRAEAAAIYAAVRTGKNRPRLFTASTREGALRASFPKGPTDFDAATYVTVEPEEH